MDFLILFIGKFDLFCIGGFANSGLALTVAFFRATI
jgi:hypothetical protein